MTPSALPSFPPRICEICGDEDRHFLRDSSTLICFDCWQSGIHREIAPRYEPMVSDPVDRHELTRKVNLLYNGIGRFRIDCHCPGCKKSRGREAAR